MVTVATEGLIELAESFRAMPVNVRQALVRSLNRAIGSGRAVMITLLKEHLGVKASALRDLLPIDPASDATPSAMVSPKKKQLGLIDLHASGPEPSRGKGRGVSYVIQGGRKVFPNAFIATMKSGHRGVFIRKGKSRLPIKELFGPALSTVFVSYQAQGQARAEEAFYANFEHELGRIGLTAADVLGESNDAEDAAA